MKVLLISLLLLSGPLYADSARMFGDKLDARELAKFLFEDNVNTDGSRSWVVDETDSYNKPTPNVAALKILFEFDSNEIKPDSLEIIGRLAQALISVEAGNKPVLIEGHTDAVGDKRYNVDLSKRRAQAVKDYLVDIFRIAPERLFVDGMGETQLFNQAFPASAINRRVQIKQYLAQPK